MGSYDVTITMVLRDLLDWVLSSFPLYLYSMF
jgi:hypothetical protein